MGERLAPEPYEAPTPPTLPPLAQLVTRMREFRDDLAAAVKRIEEAAIATQEAVKIAQDQRQKIDELTTALDNHLRHTHQGPGLRR